jgi:hypothetical protein
MFGSASKLKRLPPWAVLAVTLLSIAIVGCGSSAPTGTVAGKVTLDGAPYSGASVVFIDLETGQGGAAEIQSDGTFRIDTPMPVGSYKVYLEPKAGASAPVDPSVPGFESSVSEVDQSVPAKYWSEADSDIKVEVAEGANDDVEIALKK